MSTPKQPTKQERRDAARAARVEAEQAAAASAQKKKRLAIILGALAAVAVVAIVLIATTGGSDTAAKPDKSGKLPGSADVAAMLNGVPQSGITLGDPKAKVTVVEFIDPQCPICKQFEAIFGSAITELMKNNEAKVVVHTMTFLDLNLRNDSSVRAANGAFCAADQGKFHDYMSAVYAAQPAQEGAGWTDAQLGGLAQQVGITGTALDTWKACQQGRTYAAHISALETNSERSGVTGTPTALLNGTAMKLSGLDAAGFRAAVKAGAR